MQPSLRNASNVWFRIGLLSFGGPAAQIALLHLYVVEQRKWLSERAYLNALSFCMLLPGPEAMQMATYVGWRLNGTLGGLIAGILFVLPGALVILALASVYVFFADVPGLSAAFLGIKAATLIIVFQALIRVASKGLTSRTQGLIAIFTFVALFVFALPYPLVIALAVLVGLCQPVIKIEAANAQHEDLGPTVSWLSTLRTAILWLSLWLLPLGLVTVLAGWTVLPDLAQFFSKLALVTFGGAYAVLGYMAQDAVQQFGWLRADEMLDGLGLAETTPGPLILVTEFVGFLAAAREGATPNFGMGAAGAGVTLWATFVPCFMFVFVGAPYIEWLNTKPRLQNALTAVSAAVVGVIFNLSVWFALHVLFSEVNRTEIGPIQLFQPVWQSVELAVLAIAAVAAALMVWLKRGVILTLSACAALALVIATVSPLVQ